AGSTSSACRRRIGSRSTARRCSACGLEEGLMREAETENQVLDVEALTGILRGRATRQTFPLGPSILITTAERDAIIAALEGAERLDDAIRDALDVAVGFVGRPAKSADEKVERMKAILEAALAPMPAGEGG